MPPKAPPSSQDYVAKFSWPVLFSLGFRPFYLAGSLYAVISMAVWVAVMTGHANVQGPFDGVLWHVHELIFGFAAAILIGFLYTAASNWTRLPTPSGWWLAGLLMLWAAGRIGLIVGDTVIVAMLDLAFLPLAAIGIAIPLVRSANRRNYFTVGLIAVLVCVNVGFYAIAYDWIEVETNTVFTIAVGVFALFISIIGGRVVPFFTNNATEGKPAQRWQWLEHASAATLVVAVLLDTVMGPEEGPVMLRVGILLLAALLHFTKLVLWRPWVTLTRPILWILPLSYAWLPIGFLLRALVWFDIGLDPMLGLHAITTGAIGGMMLAMMTRSSLGHTGRPMQASQTDIIIYILIAACPIIRVFGPVLLPTYYMDMISLSGALWCAAFLLFALRYWPILSRPRFF